MMQRACVGLLMALAAAIPTNARGQGVTSPPSLGALRPLVPPAITVRTLPNGLRLWIVEQHELPVVDATLLIRSGPEADPADRLGLATLVANMLDEGAGTRSALDIADQAGFLGIELGTGAAFEGSRVSLHTAVAVLDSALALMADVTLRPTFPEADLERLRKERLGQLLQLRDRGPAIADRMFPTLVFGDEHPYGRPTNGTEASTKAITRDDLKRYYETYWRPNNAVLIVAGDVAADDIERRVTAVFGGWAKQPIPSVRAAETTVAAATSITIIDKPGAPQSSFRIGSIGTTRRTADAFPLEVMNTILGGSFTSRLNNTLREVKGYTYGAGSRFQPRRRRGPWQASAEVVAAKSDSALLEFMKELNAIRAPVPADELERAKAYLQRQLPGSFETTRDIVQQLVPMAQYDLPLNYWARYATNIAGVTTVDVQRAAQKYIDPTHLTVLIVGDRASLEPALAATGVGPVRLRALDP